MKNPLLIIAGDFVRTGGMDVANFALARRLATRGAEVHLVAHRVDPELSSLPNVHLHLVPKPGGSYLLGAPLLDWVGRFWASRIVRRGGRVVVNGGNCDVGDVCWVHYVHAAYAVENRAGLGRALKDAVARRRFLAEERRTLSKAKTILVNSDVTRRDLVRHLGVDPARVHTVYYGIDRERFGPPSEDERREAKRALGLGNGEPAIAFVGALGDRRKGFDLLFSAWSALTPRGWDARLVVIGAGAELAVWKRRAKEAGLDRSILFLGFRRDVPRVLAGCDGLAAPTRYEAYGLGVQEALCRGLPALVSASAGIAERYPPDLRDLLVAEPSVRAWTTALENWRASHKELARRLGPFAEALRARSWDDMSDEIGSLL